MFAPVTATGGNAMVVGGDSSALSAATSSGKEAPGFPKYTGGWTIESPSAGDLFANGRDDLVTISREGWLLAWRTAGPAPAAGAWWRAFHDEWNTSRLETDSRPPGAVRSASLGGGTLTFVAPGAHWYDGTATQYDVLPAGAKAWLHFAAHGAAGSTVHLSLPKGTEAARVQAANADGLVGTSVEVGAAP